MKKSIKQVAIIMLSFFVCLFIFATTANNSEQIQKDSAEGLWKSISKRGKITGLWKFYIEDGELYGVCLVALKKPIDVCLIECKNSYSKHPVKKNFNQQIMRETPLIYNLKKVSDGIWKDGYIIDARNGNRWDFDLKVISPDGKKIKVKTLEIKGGFGILKATQYWEIATKEEANKIILDTIKRNGSKKAQENPDLFLEK